MFGVGDDLVDEQLGGDEVSCFGSYFAWVFNQVTSHCHAYMEGVLFLFMVGCDDADVGRFLASWYVLLVDECASVGTSGVVHFVGAGVASVVQFLLPLLFSINVLVKRLPIFCIRQELL